MEQESPVILALYPNSVGIGYACIQVPEKLIDFGIATATPMSNSTLLKRTERFMDYYKPKIILLKEVGSSKKTERVDKLIQAITTLSGKKDLKVFRYTRQQIKDVFEIFGAHSKFDMVQKIVKMLPDLKSRAPEARKWYEKEHYQMAVFNAVSLVVTHTYITE